MINCQYQNGIYEEGSPVCFVTSWNKIASNSSVKGQKWIWTGMPDIKSIKSWYIKFKKIGNVGYLKRNGRPG